MSPIGDGISACEYCQPLVISWYVQQPLILWHFLRLLNTSKSSFRDLHQSLLLPNSFLCHKYKTCHYLGQQDVPIDASALQNAQGVHQAENDIERFSDLEAGQADVPQASTFSVRGDRASSVLIGWNWVGARSQTLSGYKTEEICPTKGNPSRHV